MNTVVKHMHNGTEILALEFPGGAKAPLYYFLAMADDPGHDNIKWAFKWIPPEVRSWIERWAPAPGPAQAGPGLTGEVDSVQRKDAGDDGPRAIRQVTYQRWWLYVFEGDTLENPKGVSEGNGLWAFAFPDMLPLTAQDDDSQGDDDDDPVDVPQYSGGP